MTVWDLKNALYLGLLCCSSGAYANHPQCNGDDPPNPYITAVTVKGDTHITLTSLAAGPIYPETSVPLRIDNSAVPVTFTWYYPMYYGQVYDPLFQQITCRNVHGDRYDTDGSQYPRGTVAIQQNGITVGSINIGGPSVTYTTPPVGTSGPIGFIAQFAPATNTNFTSTSSNSVTVMAQANPSVITAIMAMLLDD